MNKEEILKKAQSRKPNQMDEMEMDIFQKSSYIGMTVGLIMCVVLMIINIILVVIGSITKNIMNKSSL